MEKQRQKNKNMLSVVLAFAGILLTCNIVVAMLLPSYRDSIAGFFQDKGSILIDDRVIISDRDSSPVSAQGGVNLKKIEQQMEDKKAGSDAAAAQKTQAQAAKSAKKKEKKAPVITEEQKTKALTKFQDAMRARDVIQMGQEDKERPYISKALRDNPFEEVQEIDLPTTLNLESLPPEPFYPPKNQTFRIPEEQWKAYVKTLNLKGVVAVDDSLFAYLNTGKSQFFKKAGDAYTDKFQVNIDEVTLEAVLLSDEFGNKGLLEFSFREGFQVQPVDDVLYITNMSGGKSSE
jgi:hypothetical protein